MIVHVAVKCFLYKTICIVCFKTLKFIQNRNLIYFVRNNIRVN